VLKKIISLIFCLGSFATMFAGQYTRLSLKVIDPKQDIVPSLAIYKNDLSEAETTLTLLGQSPQDFYCELFLEAPTIIKLKYDSRIFELYIEPGDDLGLSFEAAKFPFSLFFIGKGAEHNTYLVKFREKFYNQRDNILTNYINSFSPIEYKKWMTDAMQKRWEYYRDYDGWEKERFSATFTQFACAEIDYWYAYHLLRYKQEHQQSAVLAQFIQIPENYYDFLNTVIINNDEALIHPLYRNFLKLYLVFRQDFPNSFLGLASKQVILKVKAASMELLANPTSKVVGYVTEGTKVLVVEKLTIGGDATGLPTAYRVKVKTSDGQEGWMRTSGLDFEPEATTLNRSGMTIEVAEITSKKIITKGKVGFRTLAVLLQPYESEIVEVLKADQEVTYLNQKTEQKYIYKDQDSITHQTIFLKIRTASGHIGWVPSVALRLTEKEVEDKVRKQRIGYKSKNAYNNIDFLLYGKSRIFALASNIEYRLHFELPKDVKPQYDLFIKENTTRYLKNEIDSIFQKAIQFPIAQPASNNATVVLTGVYDITLNVPPAKFRVETNTALILNTSSKNLKPANASAQTINPSQNTATTNTPNNINKPKLAIGTNVNINKKVETPPQTIATPQTISSVLTTTSSSKSIENAAKGNSRVNNTPTNAGIASTPSAPLATTSPSFEKVAATTAADNATAVAGEAIGSVLPKKIEVKMPNTQYDLISTSIKGTVIDPRGLNVALNLMIDVINLREVTYTTKIKADNTFALDFFLAEPAVGELICGSDTIAVYIEPNDQIELALNGKDKSFLSCNGIGGAHIMYLDMFRHFSKSIDAETKYKIRTLTPDNFRTFMHEKYRIKREFLDNYQQKNIFSPNFLEYASSDIDYWFAFNMVNYPWEYPLYFSEAPPAKVPPNYYDFLQKIKIQNDAALPSKNYRFFLDQHLSDLKRKSENHTKTPKEVTEKYFSHKTLAYCRAKQVSQDLAFDINAMKINAVKNYVLNSTYPLYNEAVVASLYRQLPIQTGASAPSFRLTDMNGKEITLDELKGKVVYLDFWATWCAPCIQALPHTERIRQRFNESEVVFVYINMDEDKSKWLRYLAEHPLGGTHVSGYSQNPYREPVTALYQATKLPSTVLIDKNGNIAADANERLDSETAAMRIQNLISK
jgi:thiol-disulfide isomerase/thioredoxin